MAGNSGARRIGRLAGRQVAKRIGCAVIASTASVGLGLSVLHGLRTSAGFLRPASVRAAAVADKQEECIYRAIRAELPRGATVYINDPVHVQRLAELSTLWVVPQASRATAGWTISLVPVSSLGPGSLAPGSPVPRHCYGLALEAQHSD